MRSRVNNNSKEIFIAYYHFKKPDGYTSERLNQSINFLDSLILGGSQGQQLELDPPSILILYNNG